MRSTFSGYYIAESGIQAARANLQITGQNMSNVNTDGYTRQRVRTHSIAAVGNTMRYSNTDTCIGQGVSTDGTEQIRDPFLDVRYRRENPKANDTSIQKSALSDIEDIVDESTKSGIDTQMKDLISQLQTLSKTPGDAVTESTVKTSASMLVKMFNNMASQMKEIKEQQLGYLQDTGIKSANELLSNIAELNKEIKSADVSGSSDLELLDARNTMIDQLSQYCNIEVDANPVPVGSGRTVDELSINLIGKNGEKYNLVDNDKYAQFSLDKDASGTVKQPVTILLNNSNGAVISSSGNGFSNDQIITGEFHGYLSVINGQGEYDTSATNTGTHDTTSAHGIPYYQKMLDTVANKFANIMNTCNSTNDGAAPGNFNKPMFTQIDGTTTSGITADTISLSTAWNTSSNAYLTNTKATLDPNIDNSKSSNNILYMISQFSSNMKFTNVLDDTDPPASTSTLIFKGTFQEGVTNLSDTLGLQIQDVTRQNDTYNSKISSVNQEIAANSSVNLDEEGINLIMYNQALSASSRLMTTLDEALNTIINKMGLVGNV